MKARPGSSLPTRKAAPPRVEQPQHRKLPSLPTDPVDREIAKIRRFNEIYSWKQEDLQRMLHEEIKGSIDIDQRLQMLTDDQARPVREARH